MKLFDWIRGSGDRRARELEALYRSAEEGSLPPHADPQIRAEFDADQRLAGQLTTLASSTGPANPRSQRSALHAKLAERKERRPVQEGIPMFGQLFQKRTVAAAGATLVLLGAAATAAAAGGAGPLTNGAQNVLDALQLSGGAANIQVCHVSEEDPDISHTISIPEAALGDHLAHGDTEGACADDATPGLPTQAGPAAIIEVCHVSDENPATSHTISIPEAALNAHLAHGDSEGACADETPHGPPDSVNPGRSDDVPVGPPDGVTPGRRPDDVPAGPPDGVTPGRPDDVPPGPPDGISPGPPDGVNPGPPDGLNLGPPAGTPVGPPTDRPPHEVPVGPPADRPSVTVPAGPLA